MTQLTIWNRKGIGNLLTVDIDETDWRSRYFQVEWLLQIRKEGGSKDQCKLPEKCIFKSRGVGSAYEELAWNGEGVPFEKCGSYQVIQSCKMATIAVWKCGAKKQMNIPEQALEAFGHPDSSFC